MRARRRAFVQSIDAAARAELLGALAGRVLDVLPEAGIVASYTAIGDEIDPARLHHGLAGRLALPWFAAADAPMMFRQAGGALEPGPFGIPQPAPAAPEMAPDVLLVPLIAADVDRSRLGQGKGHYDRALASLAARKPIRAIGLAWDVQIVAELPTDPWDVPLDLVVTPTRLIR